MGNLDGVHRESEMNVRVVGLGAGDEDRLKALVQLYVYDFSESLALDVEADGRFRTPPLDMYWSDARAHGFFVQVEEKLAGFALIQERSRLTGDETVRDVAEFFVLRRYRRHGVGEQVAAWLFDRFGGRWEVRQRVDNAAATAFWRRVIGRYTGGRYDELQWNDERWRGPVQRFEAVSRQSDGLA
ncbi:MAG: GNAT family N-acetyltransferase [Polyangiaceae bacterium]